MVLLFEGASGAALHSIIRPEDAAPRKGEWVPYLQMVAHEEQLSLHRFVSSVPLSFFKFQGKSIPVYCLLHWRFAATLQLPMAASTLAIDVVARHSFLFIGKRGSQQG